MGEIPEVTFTLNPCGSCHKNPLYIPSIEV